MARCPHLEYDDRTTFYSDDNYYCDLCRKQLSPDEVKYVCNPDYGEEYEKCPVYKDR